MVGNTSKSKLCEGASPPQQAKEGINWEHELAESPAGRLSECVCMEMTACLSSRIVFHLFSP